MKLWNFTLTVAVIFFTNISFANANLESVECKDKSGNTFQLQKNQDSTYSLFFLTVVKVFAEGYYQLDQVEVAKQLICQNEFAEITCSSTEEVQVSIPRAGVNNTSVDRKHVFRIGSTWNNIISLDGTKPIPNKYLELQATFSIDLPVGEVMNPISITGVNKKTKKVERFDFNKSNLSISLQGDEASCSAEIDD